MHILAKVIVEVRDNLQVEIIHRLPVMSLETRRRHHDLDFEIRARAKVCSCIHLAEDCSVCADKGSLAVDDCGCNECVVDCFFWTAHVCTGLRRCYRLRERNIKADVVVTRDTHIGVCCCWGIVVLVDVGRSENIRDEAYSVTSIEYIGLFAIGKEL